jgi:hypothetical protein
MIVTIILASVSMVVADVLSVMLVQAEARNRAVLAGLLDTVGWAAAIVVTLSTLNALNGHDRPLMYGVIAGVSIANFGGSYLGVRIGRRWVHEDPTTTLAQRVARLEEISPFVDIPNRNPTT